MDLSVIIVNWNVRKHLAACIRSVLQSETRYRFEVVVVDNASMDGSVEAVHKEFPQVRCISMPENKGFAYANNRGMENSTGRYVFILNPDCEVASDTIEAAVRYLDEHPKAALLAPRIENPDGSFQRGSIRSNPTLLSQLLVLLKLQRFILRLRFPSGYYQSRFDDTREQDVEQAMGAALVVRRDLLASVGTFDEGFFLWFEEVDLCRRIRAAGGLIRFVPGVRVMHRGAESFSQLSPLARQMIYSTSLLRYFRKHHSQGALFVLVACMPLAILLTALYQLIVYAKRPRH